MAVESNKTGFKTIAVAQMCEKLTFIQKKHQKSPIFSDHFRKIFNFGCIFGHVHMNGRNLFHLKWPQKWKIWIKISNICSKFLKIWEDVPNHGRFDFWKKKSFKGPLRIQKCPDVKCILGRFNWILRMNHECNLVPYNFFFFWKVLKGPRFFIICTYLGYLNVQLFNCSIIYPKCDQGT